MVLAACRFGDFSPDASLDDANPTTDAAIDGAIIDGGPDAASDAMHGYFCISTVIHRGMASDTETDYLCRLLTKTIQLDGCFRESYHESY